MTRENFIKMVKDNGIENILIMHPTQPIRMVLGGLISFTSSDDEYITLPCKLSEERYKLQESYKITLVPMVDGFATSHMYLSDFLSIVEDGHSTIYIKHKAE